MFTIIIISQPKFIYDFKGNRDVRVRIYKDASAYLHGYSLIYLLVLVSTREF